MESLQEVFKDVDIDNLTFLKFNKLIVDLFDPPTLFVLHEIMIFTVSRIISKCLELENCFVFTSHFGETLNENIKGLIVKEWHENQEQEKLFENIKLFVDFASIKNIKINDDSIEFIRTGVFLQNHEANETNFEITTNMPILKGSVYFEFLKFYKTKVLEKCNTVDDFVQKIKKDNSEYNIYCTFKNSYFRKVLKGVEE